MDASWFFARATVRPLAKSTALALVDCLGFEACEQLQKEIETKIVDYEFWDFLELLRLLGVEDLSPLQEHVSDVLYPLLPRHYSISSCPTDALHPDEVSIVVGTLQYQTTNDGKQQNKRMSALQTLQNHRELLGKRPGQIFTQ